MQALGELHASQYTCLYMYICSAIRFFIGWLFVYVHVSRVVTGSQMLVRPPAAYLMHASPHRRSWAGLDRIGLVEWYEAYGSVFTRVMRQAQEALGG